MNTPKTAEEKRNEQVIRQLYAAAEGAHKDTPLFVSYFADDGYFYDVAAGKKYYGKDIGLTVDVYAAAFPDMHRFLEPAELARASLRAAPKAQLATSPENCRNHPAATRIGRSYGESRLMRFQP